MPLKILITLFLISFCVMAQNEQTSEVVKTQKETPLRSGMSKEEKKQKLSQVFSFKNLSKLLLSERQDEIVDDYLSVFDNVTEEQITEQLNGSLQGSPLKLVIRPNSTIIKLYARAHKDDSIFKGIFGAFKDRKDFTLFVAANILLFGLNYWRKKKNKNAKGTSGFFKKVSLLFVMLFLQYTMIMYFFGENLKPAIRAYKQIQRNERFS